MILIIFGHVMFNFLHQNLISAEGTLLVVCVCVGGGGGGVRGKDFIMGALPLPSE